MNAKTYTDMARNLDIPKASPESTARAILAGVEKEDEEIFPDPISEAIAEGWRISAVKALQRQFAAYVEQTPVKRWLILTGYTGGREGLRWSTSVRTGTVIRGGV